MNFLISIMLVLMPSFFFCKNTSKKKVPNITTSISWEKMTTFHVKKSTRRWKIGTFGEKLLNEPGKLTRFDDDTRFNIMQELNRVPLDCQSEV